MIKFCKFIIINYVAIYGLNGLFSMLGFSSKLDLLYFLASLPLLYINKRIIRNNNINTLFTCIIIYFILIGLVNWGTYSPSFFYQAVRVQIWGMLFFFLGQTKFFSDDKFFDNMRIPFIIIFIISIFLYFWSPSWYIDWKLARYDVNAYATKEVAYDYFRLSGFWTLPYFVSYGSYIFISYELFKILNHKSDKYTPFFILISLITSILAMQRAPLILSIVCIIIYNVIILFKKGKFQHLRILNIILASIIILILPYIFIKFEDMNLILGRMDILLESDNFLNDRINIFSKAFRYISFFGYGLGRFGSAASQANTFAITDQEWLRMICETGILGTTLFIIFFIILISKGIKDLTKNLFELSIIVFILVSMTGANPLGNDGIMHQIIFWICAGRIINKYRNRIKTNVYINKKLIWRKLK